MVSVDSVNLAIASCRGVAKANVEAFTRVLRQEGILPPTRRGSAATGISPEHSAMILLAVLRLSPAAAAKNAKELATTVVDDGGLAPLLNSQLKSFGWPRNISLSGAVGWFIRRYTDGTLSRYVEHPFQITLTVDRYWPRAVLAFRPTLELWQEFDTGWRASFAHLKNPPAGPRQANGVKIEFLPPCIYERHASYGVDKERNREASAALSQLKAERNKFDLWGEESATSRTLIAIAELFRDERYRGCDLQGYPLDPNHPWNKELSPAEREIRLAEIEAYVTAREAAEAPKEEDPMT